MDDRGPDLLVAPTCELERDDGEPCDVVDAVSGRTVRDHSVRVLHDAGVVDQRAQVIGPDVDELRVDGRNDPATRHALDRLAQHRRRRLGDGGPRELVADPPRLGPRGCQPLRLLDVPADRRCERVGIGERHDLARTRGEEVLRVPVGGRDDGTAGGDAEAERARRDLLELVVRRHEQVGLREEVGDVVDREVAVVELDVVDEIEVDHRALERQAVSLALTSRHVRMRPARDDVDRARMALDDCRHRGDRRLDSLSGREQAEGGELELAGRIPALASSVTARQRRMLGGSPSEHRRSAVRDDPDLLLAAAAALDQQAPRRLRHHDHELGAATERGQHGGLVPRGPGQHRVQSQDDRLLQVFGQGEHVVAVPAAEDPVLVLQQDDVDVQPGEDPRRSHVVAADTLGHRRDEPGTLRPRRLVDDHHTLDSLDTIGAEERRANVGGKCADATGPRRIGRDDRSTHGLLRALPAGRRGPPRRG